MNEWEERKKLCSLTSAPKPRHAAKTTPVISAAIIKDITKINCILNRNLNVTCSVIEIGCKEFTFVKIHNK